MRVPVLKNESLAALSWLDGLMNYQYLDYEQRAAEAVGFYKNGKLRFKYPVINRRFHGPGRVWHENGALLLEEVYINGILEGERKEWIKMAC